eukprot:925245-Pelagomonas_calceolata.AAC.6
MMLGVIPAPPSACAKGPIMELWRPMRLRLRVGSQEAEAPHPWDTTLPGLLDCGLLLLLFDVVRGRAGLALPTQGIMPGREHPELHGVARSQPACTAGPTTTPAARSNTRSSFFRA